MKCSHRCENIDISNDKHWCFLGISTVKLYLMETHRCYLLLLANNLVREWMCAATRKRALDAGRPTLSTADISPHNPLISRQAGFPCQLDRYQRRSVIYQRAPPPLHPAITPSAAAFKRSTSGAATKRAIFKTTAILHRHI